ncbi:hypothetical protein CANTEDRAFT_124038 [Yamadazyma tenuis ATCC 10573]|uniref:Calcineurin-like phosphoesterase domain-containing protein n=1 Tax=Candida tenuis (strain ATCC 10573 / BCRC 21748 / CBS 615 / JCM 9827 / NBRC 10315 / NRRL Y-1498 / VKM Y-70) TaxID=590646 RepID=G3BAC1_CANTC|nr:uncharacterized protein CANTEDRAFT_124038 [Yamadazyma tenuis ATCC 10573]EGV61403.1 hypothetical protein CANTEDRAFT_124038 [Yamadazyma tenuis ATCC 10573]
MKLLFPKIKSYHQLVAGILILWVITFFIHERFLPFYVANRCQWDQLTLSKQPEHHGFHKQHEPQVFEGITNILFIADPQLIDSHTYPGRNSLLLKLSQHTVDTYIKKNYRSFVRHLDPDYIFFLGDYLDNGRSSGDKYFNQQFRRFKNIFPHKKYGFKKDRNFFINVPGNHDIGIGDAVKLESRKRFSKKFGRLNTITTINDVDFIALDTPSLMSDNGEINGDARAFIDKQFGRTISKENPRVLLSHVPLYRDPSEKPCGPLRESPTFRLSKGYQYQSVVDAGLSSEILDLIQPDLVFSGDDHDYCDIQHSESTREVTVKSISMAMGIWRPGVQLLSFVNADEEFQYKTHMCYLPRPYYNIAHYVFMAAVSGLVLLYWNSSQSAIVGYTMLPLHNMNSKKLSDFIQDQDNENAAGSSPYIMPLPSYTNTKESPRTLQSRIRQSFDSWGLIRKRFHAIAFARQAGSVSALVVAIYVIFCKTI